MLIKRCTINKYIILIFTFIIAFAMIVFSENIIIHIISILFMCSVAVGLVGFDLIHPYFWFSGFFTLYSVAYPIIVAMGFPSKIVYSKDVMIYQLVALFTILFVVSPNSVSTYKKEKMYNIKFDIGVFNRLIYMALIILIVLAAAYVSKAGFGGKDEIYASGNMILTKMFRLPLILAFLYTLSVISEYSKSRKLPIGQIIFTGAALCFITLFSGERDFIFRFLLLTIFMLWVLNILTLKGLLIITPVFALAIPLSSAYKYFFLRGSVSNTSDNILYSFLAGEFESAARNLQVLINNASSVKGCKGIGFVFSDIISVFYSGIDSATSWFDQTFYSNTTTQYGFTLVGEGYIMGGMTGIIFLFILIGILVKVFYINAYKNVYTLSSYLYFITVIIYAIRCDFGLILSAVTKQIGLVVFILWFAERLSKKRE